MEKRTKRARGSNWNQAQTVALAELKRAASLNKEDGRLVWERIGRTLSSRFPGQIRSGDQCRRRWDTLVKVYNHIEDFCVVTGSQDHRELDKGELASMKLDTAYQQDWYDIVEQVCSQRKRKERCDRDLMLAKRSKGPRTGSHSVEIPERPPNRDTLCSASTSKSVTHHEQSTPESTTTYAQVSSSPSLEADKLSPEEEVPRLKNGNDGLMLEVTQLRQHGQVSHEVSQEPQTLESANLLPHTFPAENGAQLKEPLQEDLWAWLDAMPFETLAEIEQSETEPEPFYVVEAQSGYMPSDWDLESFEQAAKSSKKTKVRRRGKISKRAMGTRRAPLPPRDILLSSDIKSFGNQDGLIPSAIMTSCTSSRSADSTICRQSRRWSLKVIVLNVLQCCHASVRKERAEDMEMESKQAARLKEKARFKKASMPKKENVPAMLNAANSTSATSATRGDKPLQKDTQRISKRAALDKKEEETMPRKAEKQQLGGKSSSKCVPVGKLCAKLSRKLFPAFHDQSSH